MPRRLRVVLDVTVGAVPIQGTITAPGAAAPTAFLGWLDLAGRLHALTVTATEPAADRPEGDGRPPE